MELIGERWSVLIVRELMLGPRRFGEIRAALTGLSAKTLTDRLEGLERLGVVMRERSPPPGPVQLYSLSEWGKELEPVLQALGRWAMRTPLHDHTLPLTPVAFMLSLRTMLVPERAGGLDLTVAFDIGGAQFVARLADRALAVEPAGRAGDATADLHFAAAAAGSFLPVFYGKVAADEGGGGLLARGDRSLAARFIGLFSLPPKL